MKHKIKGLQSTSEKIRSRGLQGLEYRHITLAVSRSSFCCPPQQHIRTDFVGQMLLGTPLTNKDGSTDTRNCLLQTCRHTCMLTDHGNHLLWQYASSIYHSPMYQHHTHWTCSPHVPPSDHFPCKVSSSFSDHKIIVHATPQWAGGLFG